MSDLTDRLSHLDNPATTPAEAVIAADVDRGRAAMARRRRARAAMAGVGLTLVLGAGLGVAVATQSGAGPSSPSATDQTTRAGTSLVAYTGDQPEGFEIAAIPDGFFVQGSDAYVFTVAPDGDTTHPLAFEDKIVVTLEDGIKAQDRIEGDPVDVGGAQGGIRHSTEATTVEFLTGDHNVVVQMWSSVGLTDAELIEFAAGITVTEAAQVPGRPTDCDPAFHDSRTPGADEFRIGCGS